MSAPRHSFVYDDFERQLLDTAKFDHAPQDLPARVSVALGLSVPFLVASELATVASATEMGASLAPSGMVATVKGALGWGTTSLFGTALKGIAIGVLSGSALLGTGHAVAHYVSSEPTRTPVVSGAPLHHLGASSRLARSSILANVAPLPPTVNVAAAPGAVSESVVSTRENPHEKLVKQAEGRHLSQLPLAQALRTSDPPPRSAEPPTGHAEPPAIPVIPEKTDAVGRFPSTGDDISALYDSAKPAILNPAPVKEIETKTDLSTAELQALRNATLQRTRTLLGQSKASLALAALEQFRNRVGAKYFGVNELLLRIEALAELGRAKEAQADVAIVERLAPASAALRQAQQLARSRFVR